jgi:hypothetical protein
MLLFHSSENAASFYGARRGILFGLPSIIVYASLEILDEKKKVGENTELSLASVLALRILWSIVVLRCDSSSIKSHEREQCLEVVPDQRDFVRIGSPSP